MNSAFTYGDFVFTKNGKLECTLGLDNETLANAAVKGIGFSGAAVIPGFVTDLKGQTYKVCKIGIFSFRECKNLTSVTLPNTIQRICRDSFFKTSIKELVVPSSVEVLEYAAFSYMNQVRTITFQSGSKLRTISTSTFAYCHLLVSITIPPTVTTVKLSPFSFGTNLITLYFCSSHDMSSIVTPFLDCSTPKIFVPSSYPKGATFGGVPVEIDDSRCFQYSNWIDSKCSSHFVSHSIVSHLTLVFTFLISS